MPKLARLHTLNAQIGRKMQRPHSLQQNIGFQLDKLKNFQSGPNLHPTAMGSWELMGKYLSCQYP